MGIREIQAQMDELTRVYHMEQRRLQEQIDYLRAKRGYKPKTHGWDGYVEVGRDTQYRTPHGDL